MNTHNPDIQWNFQDDTYSMMYLKNEATDEILEIIYLDKLCLRCGTRHSEHFYRLNNPLDFFNYYSICSVTGQPVLLGYFGVDAPEEQECPVCEGTGKVKHKDYE